MGCKTWWWQWYQSRSALVSGCTLLLWGCAHKAVLVAKGVKKIPHQSSAQISQENGFLQLSGLASSGGTGWLRSFGTPLLWRCQNYSHGLTPYSGANRIAWPQSWWKLCPSLTGEAAPSNQQGWMQRLLVSQNAEVTLWAQSSGWHLHHHMEGSRTR